MVSEMAKGFMSLVRKVEELLSRYLFTHTASKHSTRHQRRREIRKCHTSDWQGAVNKRGIKKDVISRHTNRIETAAARNERIIRGFRTR